MFSTPTMLRIRKVPTTANLDVFAAKKHRTMSSNVLVVRANPREGPQTSWPNHDSFNTKRSKTYPKIYKLSKKEKSIQKPSQLVKVLNLSKKLTNAPKSWRIPKCQPT